MKTRKKLVCTSFMIGLLFFPFLSSSPSIKAQETLTHEAKLLIKTESQYLDARLNDKWEMIYSFQHPDFQKSVSLEEFKYFRGKVFINYRKDQYFHRISGAPSYPSVEEIKKTPRETGFMGITFPTVYHFFQNPLARAESYKLKKVLIANNDTLGKAIVRISIAERLPILFRMADTKIKRETIYIDYWEKVNGKWFITLMKTFSESRPHISGGQTKQKEHLIPRDISPWEKAQFTEFNIPDP